MVACFQRGQLDGVTGLCLAVAVGATLSPGIVVTRFYAPRSTGCWAGCVYSLLEVPCQYHRPPARPANELLLTKTVIQERRHGQSLAYRPAIPLVKATTSPFSFPDPRFWPVIKSAHSPEAMSSSTILVKTGPILAFSHAKDGRRGVHTSPQWTGQGRVHSGPQGAGQPGG